MSVNQLWDEIQHGVHFVTDPLCFDWKPLEPTKKNLEKLDKAGVQFWITRSEKDDFPESLCMAQKIKVAHGDEVMVTICASSASHFISQLLKVVKDTEKDTFCLTVFFSKSLLEDKRVQDIMASTDANKTDFHRVGLVALEAPYEELRKKHQFV